VTAFSVSRSSRPSAVPERMAADQLPIDWMCQRGLQIGIRFRLACPGGPFRRKTPAFGDSIATGHLRRNVSAFQSGGAHEAHL
jgi:hypothetical protein